MLNNKDEFLEYYNNLFEECETQKEVDALYKTEVDKIGNNALKKNDLYEAYYINTKLLSTKHAREYDAKLKGSSEINKDHYKPGTVSYHVIQTARSSKKAKTIIISVLIIIFIASIFFSYL